MKNHRFFSIWNVQIGRIWLTVCEWKSRHFLALWCTAMISFEMVISSVVCVCARATRWLFDRKWDKWLFNLCICAFAFDLFAQSVPFFKRARAQKNKKQFGLHTIVLKYQWAKVALAFGQTESIQNAQLTIAYRLCIAQTVSESLFDCAIPW